MNERTALSENVVRYGVAAGAARSRGGLVFQPPNPCKRDCAGNQQQNVAIRSGNRFRWQNHEGKRSDASLLKDGAAPGFGCRPRDVVTPSCERPEVKKLSTTSNRRKISCDEIHLRNLDVFTCNSRLCCSDGRPRGVELRELKARRKLGKRRRYQFNRRWWRIEIQTLREGWGTPTQRR